MLDTMVAGLLVLQDEAAPLGLQVNWTKTKIQHVGEPQSSDPVDGPGGSRERRLGGRVYLPRVADLTRRRKRGRNSATHHDRKGMLNLPPREAHLEFPHTHMH